MIENVTPPTKKKNPKEARINSPCAVSKQAASSMEV